MDRKMLAREMIGLAKSLTAARKQKYKGYTIEESGMNFYVTDPSGHRAFEDVPATIETAKKWIDWDIYEKRKKVSSSDGATNKKIVARELVKMAKMLAGSKRTAAANDLAEIREILPEMYEKQEEIRKKIEEAQREHNRLLSEASAEMESKEKELLDAIEDALVAYFDGPNGKGVRQVDNQGKLLEVFVGNKDGVNRHEAKVSVHLSLYFKEQERVDYMIRNDDLDAIKGKLEDKNTVKSLVAKVREADQRGFFDVGVDA